MNYNELYNRVVYIAAINTLELPAKAKAEALIMRAAYAPAIDTFEKERSAIMADEKATDEEKATAINARAEEQCAAPDRRFTPEAFEQIVGAAIARGTVSVGGQDFPAAAFAEAVAFNLVKLD